MLENINRRQWSPNLIGFDAEQVYLSASYCEPSFSPSALTTCGIIADF
jgi:hypothetical protein